MSDYEVILNMFHDWKPTTGESSLGKFIRVAATSFTEPKQPFITYFFDSGGKLIEVTVKLL